MPHAKYVVAAGPGCLLSCLGHEGRRVILDHDNVALAVGTLSEQLGEVAWGRSGWEDICRAFAEVLPGSVPIIRNVDLQRQAVNAMFAQGIDPEFIDSYRDHYFALDPWMTFAGTVPHGEVRLTERDCPSSTFDDSEFYADWLSSRDELKAAAGMRIDVDANNTVIVCLHYAVERAASCDAVAAAVLEGVRPGLVDAVRSAAKLRHGLERSRRLGLLLERIHGAALLTNAGRRICEANAQASIAMAQGDILSGTGDMLGLRDPAAHRWLEEAVPRLAAQRLPETAVAVFAAGDQLFRISVTRAPDYGETGFALLVQPRPQVLVVVRRLVDVPMRLDAGALHLAFGLSGAETRLCELLANGSSLVEAAAILRISEGTVRQRAKAVFAKTRTHRQGQLVALVARFAADQ